MTSSNEDNIEKAIDLAISGKLNPEKLKRAMPQSFATLRDAEPSEARLFVKTLMDRAFAIALSKLLQYPTLMTQDIRFRLPSAPENQLNFKRILFTMSLYVGTDPTMTSAPYWTSFLDTFSAHVERRCELFSLNHEKDNSNHKSRNSQDGYSMISEIYYTAYRGTAYQLQHDIETFHDSDKTLEQVCRHINNKDGFVRSLKATLEKCVTLPSEVSTVDELLKETCNYFRAQAVTHSFSESVRVVEEYPDVNKFVQCWVCQKDNTKNCASCNVAAFCGKACQKAAWKRNHKLLCPQFRQIREYAQDQCKKIAEVHRHGFIPGSTLIPNPYIDYTLVTISANLLAQKMRGEPLDLWIPNQLPSMDNFYNNLVRVSNNDQAFQALFKEDEGDGNHEEIDSLLLAQVVSNVTMGLMCNGNGPPLPNNKKITRDTFLSEYKGVDSWPKMSEQLVMASVTDDLFEMHQSQN